MKYGGPERSLNAAESCASTGSTSKKGPNTAFMASSDVAIPPLRLKNSRRLNPSLGASRQPRGLGQDAVLDRALRRRLRQRRELLVGDQTRRQRRLRAKPAAHAGMDVEGVRVVVSHGAASCRDDLTRFEGPPRWPGYDRAVDAGPFLTRSLAVLALVVAA